MEKKIKKIREDIEDICEYSSSNSLKKLILDLCNVIEIQGKAISDFLNEIVKDEKINK